MPPARGGLGPAGGGPGPGRPGPARSAPAPVPSAAPAPTAGRCRAPAQAPTGVPRPRPRPDGRSGPGPRPGPAGRPGGSPPRPRLVPARAGQPPPRSGLPPARSVRRRGGPGPRSRWSPSVPPWPAARGPARAPRRGGRAGIARRPGRPGTGSSITVMPRVAATAASAARSAPGQVAGPAQRARGLDPDPVGDAAGRPGARRRRPARHCLAPGEPAQPDQRHQLGVGYLATIVSSRSVTSEATWPSSVAVRAGSPAADSHQAVPSRMSARSRGGASAGSSSPARW